MRKPRIRIILTAVLFVVAAATLQADEPAAASPAPSREPVLAEEIHITAETFEVLDQAGTIRGVGDVRVVNGDVILTADTVTATYGPDRQIRTLTATGHVVVTRGTETATSQLATYDSETGYLRLTGEPVLTRPGMRLVDSDAIEYRREVGKFTALGRPTIALLRETVAGEEAK